MANTVTPTNTGGMTATPSPPVIAGGTEPGDGSVSGTASPLCAKIQICAVAGGGTMPSAPPCTAPDTMLGMGTTNAGGLFTIAIMPPLMAGECIYAFDTCTSLVSAVQCVGGPAPAPALSPRALALAVATLGLVAMLALMRLRAPRPQGD
jgi:hypothetical protein